jgi:tetratricopeptide (TPR) repeat protein
MLTPTRKPSTCYPSGSRLRGARAVLLFALGIGAIVATRVAIKKSRSVMEALVEASAEAATRPHEGRLSGPFPYRPYAPPSRSAASRARSAIRQIQIENVADARIRALTGLLLNETDAVVEILEERLRDTTGQENLLDAMHSTTDMELLNQLAVAYLSSSEDEPQHTLLALEAMERASQLSGTERVETAWNRALALQRFGLRDEARAAWRHYVDIDSSSPWSTEARSHVQSLLDPGRARTREELLIAMKISVAAGDGAALRRLIVEDQEQFRIVSEEEVLPEAASELPIRGQSWRLVRAAATELTARGDPLLADTLDSLERSNASSLLMAVRALNDYRRGRIAMSAGNLKIAFEALSAATTALERAGIPFASRAAVYRSTVRIYDGQPEDAVRLIDNAIASASRLERWPLLGAQLYWVRGLGLSHLGNSGAALRAYERAARFVRWTHEDASRAGLEQVTADALRDVSNLSEAWPGTESARPQWCGTCRIAGELPAGRGTRASKGARACANGQRPALSMQCLDHRLSNGHRSRRRHDGRPASARSRRSVAEDS